MNPLQQSASPRQRLAETSNLQSMEPDGFVDDEVVFALIAGRSQPRVMADSQDLVLPAEDIDFAGWTMPAPLPSRFTPPIVSPPESHERRPEPPKMQKAPAPPRTQSIGRWWFACLIGTLFTLSLAALLYALADRGILSFEGFPFPAGQQEAPLQSTPEAPSKDPANPNSRP